MTAQQYVGTIKKTLTKRRTFSVFVFDVDSINSADRKPVRCISVGRLPDSEWMIITGRWNKHPIYGWQFKVFRSSPTMPRTEHGIRRYLKNGAIPGIGCTLADRLVDTFGHHTLQIMDHDPARLTAVHGIGGQIAESIGRHVREARKTQHAIVALTEFGLDHELASAFYLRYGDDAIERLKNNPFQVLGNYPFFRFDLAAKVASDTLNLEHAGQALASSVVQDRLINQSRLTVHRSDISDYLAGCDLSVPNPTDLVNQAISSLTAITELKLASHNVAFTTPWLYDKASTIAKSLASRLNEPSQVVAHLNKLLKPHLPAADDDRLLTVIDAPSTVDTIRFVRTIVSRLNNMVDGMTIETLLPTKADVIEFTDFRYWPTPCKEIGSSGKQYALMTIIANAHDVPVGLLARHIQNAESEGRPVLIIGNSDYQSALGSACFRDLIVAAHSLHALVPLGAPPYTAYHHPIHPEVITHCLGSKTVPLCGIDYSTLSESPTVRIAATSEKDQVDSITEVLKCLADNHTIASYAIVTEHEGGPLSADSLNLLAARISSPHRTDDSNNSLAVNDIICLSGYYPSHTMLRRGLIASVISVSQADDTCNLSVHGRVVRTVPMSSLLPATLGYATHISHQTRPQRLYVIFVPAPDADTKLNADAYQRLLGSVAEHLVVIGDVNDPEPRFGSRGGISEVQSVIRACLPDHT